MQDMSGNDGIPRIPVVRASRDLPRGIFAMVWRMRAYLPNRPVGVLSCPFAPSPAILPCAAASRLARGMSGLGT